MSKGNIREFLGVLIEKKILDITQNDADEFDPNIPETAYIELFMEDGSQLRVFTLPDTMGPAFCITHGDDCSCTLCQDEE